MHHIPRARSVSPTKALLAWQVVVCLASTPAIGEDKTPPSIAELSSDIATLKSMLQQQQSRIDAQDAEIGRLRALIREDEANNSKNNDEKSSKVAVEMQQAAEPKGLAAAAKSSLQQGPPAHGVPVESPAPLSLKLGNVFFRPVGFAELTSIFRSTNVGTGSGTNFGLIPFNSSIPGQLTETRLSAQNSRIGMRVDASPFGTKIIGYVEADFVGGQVLDALVTRNSSPLNLRLFFAHLQRPRFEITAGQAWSLMTPNRRGLSPLPGDVFYTLNLDTNYNVGLIWSRTPQLRVVYHPVSSFYLGASIENSSQYVGPYVLFPSNTPSGYYGQLDTGSLSSNVPALTPDFVGKLAVDRRLGGKQLHAELAGIFRSFKVVHPVFGRIDARAGIGGAVNFDLELFRGFHVLTNNYASSGGGRQISGLAPDVVVRGDGSLSPVRAHSTLDGVEYRLSQYTTLFAYYGGVSTKPNLSTYMGQLIGFGIPPSAVTNLGGPYGAANRSIQEATIGFSRTIWRDPVFGAIQWNGQVSYVTRRAWATTRSAETFMTFVNLRYILP